MAGAVEGYKINDRRGEDRTPTEPCRVCGAPGAHTREYNKPTMECIHYLRGRIIELEGKLQHKSGD
jgi:hypothetical protein